MTRKSVYRTRVRRRVCSARAALLLTPHPPTAPPNPFPVLDYFDEEEDARITFSAADDVQAAADIAAEALPHTAWMARAQADAARKGVPLKQFLDDHSHVKDSTRDSYHKAIQHFQETVIAVMFPGVDMLDLGLEQLAAAVEVHMTGLMTQSMSGRFKSVIETFSAAMNFKLILADRVALNPFTLQKIKNSKKAKFKLQNKYGDSKKQAPCLSDDEYRLLIASIFSRARGGGFAHASVEEQVKSVELATAVVLGKWTAMRGCSLLRRAPRPAPFRDAAPSAARALRVVLTPNAHALSLTSSACGIRRSTRARRGEPFEGWERLGEHVRARSAARRRRAASHVCKQ